MDTVNEALGHIRPSELRPGHIAALYANWQGEGVCKRQLPALSTTNDSVQLLDFSLCFGLILHTRPSMWFPVRQA